MSDIVRRLPTARLTPQQAARSRTIAGLGAFCLILLLLVFAMETLARVGVPYPILAWIVAAFALGAPAIVAISAPTMSARIFAVAAREVPVANSTMAGVAALFGSVFAIGLGAAFFRSEAEMSALAIGLCGGIFASGVLIAPYVRRSSAASLGDFLAGRFGGRAIPGLVAIALIAAVAPMLTAELSLFGMIGAARLGIGPGSAVTLAAVLIVVPPLLGGMRGVTTAAILQFILLFAALVATSIFMSQAVTGSPLPFFGYAVAIAGGAPIPATGTAQSVWQSAGLAFSVMLGIAAFPTLLARAATTPSSRAARMSIAWTLLFTAVLCVAAASIAAIAFHLDRTINPEIAPFIAAERVGAPPFVGMLLTAGCFAASLSAGSLLLLVGARAFGHDFVFRFALPGLPMSRRLLVQRAGLVAGAITAAKVALNPPADYLTLALAGLSLSASGLLPVLLLAVWWRRANRAGALTGMLVGLAISAYVACAGLYDARLFEPLDKAGLKELAMTLGVERIALVAAPAALLVAMLVSLATRAPAPEQRSFAEALFSPRDIVADD